MTQRYETQPNPPKSETAWTRTPQNINLDASHLRSFGIEVPPTLSGLYIGLQTVWHRDPYELLRRFAYTECRRLSALTELSLPGAIREVAAVMALRSDIEHWDPARGLVIPFVQVRARFAVSFLVRQRMRETARKQLCERAAALAAAMRNSEDQ